MFFIFSKSFFSLNSLTNSILVRTFWCISLLHPCNRKHQGKWQTLKPPSFFKELY